MELEDYESKLRKLAILFSGNGLEAAAQGYERASTPADWDRREAEMADWDADPYGADGAIALYLRCF